MIHFNVSVITIIVIYIYIYIYIYIIKTACVTHLANASDSQAVGCMFKPGTIILDL